MPLNAGDPGYGSVSAPGLSSSVGGSESAPLLIPEPDVVQQWRPMSKQELEIAAGGPGWRKVRCYLVVLFWLAWFAILATSIAIIVKSPRPVAKPLKWWQKSLFYQLQPDMFLEEKKEGSGGINVLCEQLPYLRSLGIGALILEGLFDKETSPLNITVTGKSLGTLPEIEHLLRECSKAGVKVVLDFCELEEVADEPSKPSETVQRALRFWLEQGVAGFSICDTDAAYSEKTLSMWRGVFKEFSSEEEERIVVVKQTRDVLPPLNNSSQVNVTLVDFVIRSILPTSPQLLSAQEVADAIETRLQIPGDIWPSWTVGGKASYDLKKLLLVLIMTLPGSPAVQYDEDLNQTQNASLHLASSNAEQKSKPPESHADKEEMKRSTVALFNSLSHSRAREEALLYGNFTFLPFNSTSNSTLSSPTSPPILAFLRSWGCVHFLILLNVGPELHALDPAWAPSLPTAGVFVTSTGMDRLGATSLYTLELQPHEAIVIKLFEAGSYS